MKYCAECRLGEHTKPADWYVTGYDTFYQCPVRKYVCDDHLEVIQDYVRIKKTTRA